MKIYTKVSIVIEKNGKILLIKEWSNKKNGYFWNLVKGTYGDAGEETLSGCATREAMEEAGINIKIERLLSCYIYAEDLVGLQFNFLAHPYVDSDFTIPDIDEQTKRGEKIIEIKWLSKKKVLSIPQNEFVSKRAYETIRDWTENKEYSLTTLASIE